MTVIEVLQDRIEWNKLGISDEQEILVDTIDIDEKKEVLALIEDYNAENIELEKAITILEEYNDI